VKNINPVLCSENLSSRAVNTEDDSTDSLLSAADFSKFPKVKWLQLLACVAHDVLDMSAAFDTIDHGMLLNVGFGVSGSTLSSLTDINAFQ